MKTKLLFAIAVIFLLSSCEYHPGVSEAFAKYRFKKGVTTITVPGWVIGLAAQFGDLEDNERDLVESIDKVRVLVVENEELNQRINLHREFSEKINRKNDYEQLLSVKDKNEDVTIFGKMDGNVITEMVVLVGGEENVLVYVRGEIDPKLIDKNIDYSNAGQLFSFKN
jgi:hypothetical protein